MNAIPVVFNERQISRTMLGGGEKPRNAEMPVCAVLLSRAPNSRRDSALESLLQNGFSSIVSVEPPGDNGGAESLIQRFPSVTFILLHEAVSPGEMINLALGETSDEYALVLHDALKITPQMFTPRIFRRIAESDAFCTAPYLLTHDLRPIPVCFSPSVQKKRFAVAVSPLFAEGRKTLYPLDHVALFHRERFMRLGGYDYTIASPYWQNLDFSLRAWLWGEETRFSPLMQFSYEADRAEEDAGEGASSLRFFLKNIAPVVQNDHGYIPLSAFYGYWRKAGCSLPEARAQFADGRAWVETNKYRFRLDVAKLAASWQEQKPEGV
ncbi:hypothetical protein [Treponema endosymbiont of Eucomonympha sp.]|uniref:hypothetical protein n=1 Tax=Treponema endosymbiont of Eucomonympha sp. TaxID=1580831 RepID=UPI00078634DE|nr:hypothetical protein [Treponema endosymbiont of Eucomonympha sp.]